MPDRLASLSSVAAVEGVDPYRGSSIAPLNTGTPSTSASESEHPRRSSDENSRLGRSRCSSARVIGTGRVSAGDVAKGRFYNPAGGLLQLSVHDSTRPAVPRPPAAAVATGPSVGGGRIIAPTTSIRMAPVLTYAPAHPHPPPPAHHQHHHQHQQQQQQQPCLPPIFTPLMSCEVSTGAGADCGGSPSAVSSSFIDALAPDEEIDPVTPVVSEAAITTAASSSSPSASYSPYALAVASSRGSGLHSVGVPAMALAGGVGIGSYLSQQQEQQKQKQQQQQLQLPVVPAAVSYVSGASSEVAITSSSCTPHSSPPLAVGSLSTGSIIPASPTSLRRYAAAASAVAAVASLTAASPIHKQYPDAEKLLLPQLNQQQEPERLLQPLSVPLAAANPSYGSTTNSALAKAPAGIIISHPPLRGKLGASSRFLSRSSSSSSITSTNTSAYDGLHDVAAAAASAAAPNRHSSSSSIATSSGHSSDLGGLRILSPEVTTCSTGAGGGSSMGRSVESTGQQHAATTQSPRSIPAGLNRAATAAAVAAAAIPVSGSLGGRSGGVCAAGASTPAFACRNLTRAGAGSSSSILDPPSSSMSSSTPTSPSAAAGNTALLSYSSGGVFLHHSLSRLTPPLSEEAEAGEEGDDDSGGGGAAASSTADDKRY